MQSVVPLILQTELLPVSYTHLDDFYKAELKNNDVKVDAFTSATLNKSRTAGMMNGNSAYHVDQMCIRDSNESILSKIGTAIAWIFAPLGWTKAGEGWKMAVAAVTGLIAKENVVAATAILHPSPAFVQPRRCV